MPDTWQLAFVLLFMFVAVEALAILALARSVGLLLVGAAPGPLETADGPMVGSEAPAISGYELKLRRAISPDLSRDRWVLIFISATCALCRQVANAAAHLEVGVRRTTLLVARGSDDQNELFRKYAPDLLLISDSSGDLHRAFKVDQAPFGILVEDGRVVAKGVVNSRDHLELLLERRTTRLPDEAWVPVGPAEELPERRGAS